VEAPQEGVVSDDEALARLKAEDQSRCASLYLTDASLHYAVDSILAVLGTPLARDTTLGMVSIIDAYGKRRVDGERARFQAEVVGRMSRHFIPRSIG
jgi:hypothetical protein